LRANFGQLNEKIVDFKKLEGGGRRRETGSYVAPNGSILGHTILICA